MKSVEGLFENLKPELINFERKRKKVLISSVFTRIYMVVLQLAVLSFLMGFLKMFPFEEFDMPVVTNIFLGFFYLIMLIVLFSLAKDHIKNWYKYRNPAKLKDKQFVLIVQIILSAVIAVSAYFIGAYFLGTETVSKATIFKVGATIIIIAISFFIVKLIEKIEENFSNKYKAVVLPQLLHAINDSITYQADKCVTQDAFTKSKLFKFQTIYEFKGRDLISGVVGDIHFNFSQLKVEDKTQRKTAKGKETEIKVIFNGTFYHSDFNKKFSGTTFIFPDSARKVFGGALGEMFNEVISNKERSLVKLEDVEFEKEFAVFSSDQVEARYILTPSMIELIYNLKQHFMEDIYISFSENKLFIGIQSQINLLNPRIFRKADSYYTFEQYYNNVKRLLDITNELKLNVNIWKS